MFSFEGIEESSNKLCSGARIEFIFFTANNIKPPQTTIKTLAVLFTLLNKKDGRKGFLPLPPLVRVVPIKSERCQQPINFYCNLGRTKSRNKFDESYSTILLNIAETDKEMMDLRLSSVNI
jgi:hypothetical protein